MEIQLQNALQGGSMRCSGLTGEIGLEQNGVAHVSRSRPPAVAGEQVAFHWSTRHRPKMRSAAKGPE